MDLTLEITNKKQVKTKINQFKKLIDFNDDTQTLMVTIQGRTILDSYGSMYLYRENIIVKDSQLIVEMYNQKISEFKDMVYLNLTVYEK